MKVYLVLVFILLGLMINFSVQANELRLAMENDTVYQSDGYYTHGTWLSFTRVEDGQQQWLSRKPVAYRRFSIGQYLYTPDDTSISELIEDDRPYGGVLYGEVTDYVESKNNMQSFSILLGIVGPLSHAETLQTWMHKVTDSKTPQGWKHQINDEIVLNFGYSDRYRSFDYDWINNVTYYGVQVGNLNTHSSVGSIFKFGWNVPNSYDIIRLEPTPRQYRRKWNTLRSYSLYGFAASEGRIVARNIFFDGNIWEDSHNVEKEPIVGDFIYGIGVDVWNVEITYSVTYRTKEFKGQKRDIKYNGISIAYKW